MTLDACTACSAAFVEEMNAIWSLTTDAERQPVVNTAIAARMLGISPGTVEQLVARGELPATRIGRATRLSLAVLKACVQDHTEYGHAARLPGPAVRRSVVQTTARVDPAPPSPAGEAR